MGAMNKPMERYLKPPPRFVWAGYVAAAVLMAGAVAAGWGAQRQYAAAAALAQRLAKLRADTAVIPLPVPTKSETEQRKRWAELQTERDFAWAPLFAALERAGNADIELLEFHPDKSNGSVLLRGEARDEAALLDFVEALSLNPVLHHVYLSHQKIRKRDRLVTVSFELKAGIVRARR